MRVPAWLHRERPRGALLVLALMLGGCGAWAVTWDRPEDGYPTEPPPVRVESYGGVQVRVPSSWAEGATSPMLAGTQVLVCGDGAEIADLFGTPAADLRPYVGRAVPTSGPCQRWVDGVVPQVESVWFDSNEPPGRWELGGGWWRETELLDKWPSVTVTSRDVATIEQVLGSITIGYADDSNCPIDPPQAPSGLIPREAEPEVEIGAVTGCLYLLRDGAPVLVHSSRAFLEPGFLQRLVTESPQLDEVAGSCGDPVPEPLLWVALRWELTDGSRVWASVVPGDCDSLVWRLSGTGVRRDVLAPFVRDPWFDLGMQAYAGGLAN